MQSNNPGGRPGADQVSENTESPHTPPPTLQPLLRLDPSDDEIEAWADQERKRREAWLKGPTPEEKKAWARRERARRRAEAEAAQDEAALKGEPSVLRYPREAQLVAEGAVSLAWKMSQRSLGLLVRAGREWEEEWAKPRRPHRVPLDEDDS
jgi:hypothetical protein